MSKITNSTQVQAGCWFTYCCWLDLEEVLPSRVESLRAELRIQESPVPIIWTTKREALEEICEGVHDEESLSEIDALIADLDI